MALINPPAAAARILSSFTVMVSTMGIKGVKHSKRSEKAGGLIVWGAIVAVFSVLSIVMNLVNGGEFNVTSVLTGVAVPALYIYGAVLNSKADAQYTA